MINRDCNNDEVVLNKVSFVVTVSKSHDYSPQSSEMILTKEDYQEIFNHLINSKIHLNQEDRKILDEMDVNIDAVLRMINESASWIEIPRCNCVVCNCKDCTQMTKYHYLNELPAGKLIFTKDITLKDKNEVEHFIKSPTYSLHSITDGVHSFTMFSSEDLIQYDESDTECNWRSLRSTLHSHSNKEILDTYTKTQDDLISSIKTEVGEKYDSHLEQLDSSVSALTETTKNHSSELNEINKKVSKNTEDIATKVDAAYVTNATKDFATNARISDVIDLSNRNDEVTRSVIGASSLDELKSKLNTTDKSNIVAAINELDARNDKFQENESTSVVLNNHTEYRCKVMASLNLSLPETIPDDYNSRIVFESGEIATTLSYTAGSIKFTGDDCDSSNAFVPATNTSYEVDIKYLGLDSSGNKRIVARVGAF